MHPANGGGKLPGVVVIHENRGLNPYIEDVARRLAAENFIAFAPDAPDAVGGYPGDEEKAMALFAHGSIARSARRTLWPRCRCLKAASASATVIVGAVGFCFGGDVVNTMAVRIPDLAAAVPFYGAQPSAADTAKIKAPLLIHYAGVDERIDAGWPAWKAALDRDHVRYQEDTYPGVNHGFHNDTTPRYDEAAAKLAWSRTLAFFNEHLKR